MFGKPFEIEFGLWPVGSLNLHILYLSLSLACTIINVGVTNTSQILLKMAFKSYEPLLVSIEEISLLVQGCSPEKFLNPLQVGLNR